MVVRSKRSDSRVRCPDKFQENLSSLFRILSLTLSFKRCDQQLASSLPYGTSLELSPDIRKGMYTRTFIHRTVSCITKRCPVYSRLVQANLDTTAAPKYLNDFPLDSFLLTNIAISTWNHTSLIGTWSPNFPHYGRAAFNAAVILLLLNASTIH